MRRRAAVLAGVMLAACGSRDATRAPAEPQFDARISVDRARPLPDLAAQLLEPRMRRHGAQLMALQAAVISVDHPRVASEVRILLAEPRLARPSAAAGETLNDALPAEFFDLQDQLVSAAHALEAAAAIGDDATLAAAFSDLTATCVSCHATYLGIEGIP